MNLVNQLIGQLEVSKNKKYDLLSLYYNWYTRIMEALQKSMLEGTEHFFAIPK